MMKTLKQVVVLVGSCCLSAVSVDAQQNSGARSIGGGSCEESAYNCVGAPNPLPVVDTVWIEEMTWMDVRDAMAAGKKTIIIPTGGIEPNGPWLALGKHNYILRATCDAIARKLGNALCAPTIPFVPEGYIDEKTGHMDTMGTISVEQSTYEALVTDIARSMEAHGFENIVLISDTGGSNNAGMNAVAEELNNAWKSTATVYYIPEYYESWYGAEALLLQKGVIKVNVKDGIHDDPATTLLMMVTDPSTVRWEERVDADVATIDGVSIAAKKKALRLGRELLEYRATVTVDAITKAIDTNRIVH